MTPYIHYYLPMNFTDGFTFADGRIKMRSIVEAVVAFVPILLTILFIKPPPNVMFGVIAFSASILVFVCTIGIDGNTPSQFIMRYVNYRKVRGISFYNPAANKSRSDEWSFDNSEDGGIKGIQKRAQEIVQSSGITEDTVGVDSAEKILMGKNFVFKDDVEIKTKPSAAAQKKGKSKAQGNHGKPLAPTRGVPKPPPAPKKKPVNKSAMPAHPLRGSKPKLALGIDVSTPIVDEARQGTYKESPREDAVNAAPKPAQEVESDCGAVPASRVMQPTTVLSSPPIASAAEMPLEEAARIDGSPNPADTKGAVESDFVPPGVMREDAEVFEVVDEDDGASTDEVPSVFDFTFD